MPIGFCDKIIPELKQHISTIKRTWLQISSADSLPPTYSSLITLLIFYTHFTNQSCLFQPTSIDWHISV